MILTETDTHLIVEECTLQSATSPLEIARFAMAYTTAKWWAHRNAPHKTPPLNMIQDLAQVIDPRNTHYRQVPVLINGIRIGATIETIERQMNNLFIALETNYLADEAYQEFEEIHPYIDGNGRTGFLLWAMLLPEWPTTLPPEFKTITYGGIHD